MKQISSIRSLFRKFLPGVFFRRVFRVYIGIILAMMLVLLAALGWNLSHIKYGQSLDTSDQVIRIIDGCLEGKLRGAVTLEQRLFQDNATWNYLIARIDDANADPDPYLQREINRSVSRVSYGIKQGFGGLLTGSPLTGDIYSYGYSDISIETRIFRELLKDADQYDEAGLVSARTEGNRGNAFSLFVVLPMNAGAYRRTGLMAVIFNAMDIRHSYQDFDRYLRGEFLVIGGDGDVLYRSGEDYAAPLPEGITEMLTESTCVRNRFGEVYNIYYSSRCNYYVVNYIPRSVILADIWIPLRTMLVVFFITLIFAAAANLVCTRMFARRIDPIIATIDQVKSGNLTSFPIRRRYDDEIGYIYTELLRMCASLDEHIQTEYVYRLREKEMELYMLQTQIDPHFLYNTLEAIRMKLFVEGETDASRMICTLAGLFRSMMSKDAVVTMREETENLAAYLELFQFRMGDRLTFSLEMDPGTMRFATLRHILQPIVENALVHGIEEDRNPKEHYHVTIRGNLEGDELCFRVIDNGCGIAADKLDEINRSLRAPAGEQPSIGIYNVNRRLIIVYGQDAGLTYESAPDIGTTVSFRVKAWKKKELEENVKTFDRG